MPQENFYPILNEQRGGDPEPIVNILARALLKLSKSWEKQRRCLWLKGDALTVPAGTSAVKEQKDAHLTSLTERN
jgi:hypothetical protein